MSVKMLLRFHLALLVFLSYTSSVSSLNSDGLALLALKAAVRYDPTRFLSSWSDSDATPCRWAGIGCSRGRVSSLSLPDKSLTGYIPSELGLLDSLTRINLSHNNFSNLIPARIFNATKLVFLDLSHNSLSGQVPQVIKVLKNLIHLDLSSNSLNGSLPEFLTELSSLSGTLNLSYNGFSGEIPTAFGHFPVMVSLDLSHNNLSGEVPQVGSLLNQGPTAFSGNAGLCGFPLGISCPEPTNPTHSLNSESPEKKPENTDHPDPGSYAGDHRDDGKDKNGLMTVPVISGVSVVIGAVTVTIWLMRRKWRPEDEEKGELRQEKEFEEEAQRGKFAVVDEGFVNVELEDLLRASAYVVGKGRSGILYKVVAGRGPAVGTTVVAVRRLCEGEATWRFKEFEAEVEAIGKANHPNIVRLKAYYYASDEKLLITDFIRNGSLYSALHGPSNESPQLSWAARLRIVQGTARGLMYIHEYSPRKYVHGSLKSTKILLDTELQPSISGFGLTRLIPAGTSRFSASLSKKSDSILSITGSVIGSKISAASNFYQAPEARAAGAKLTQKCDVYSFGIVLMEILTGRLADGGPENEDGKGLESAVRKVFREKRALSEIIDPGLLKEVHAKKQVLTAFHIALNCTELDPELRPRMRTVVESLDRIKCE